MYRLKFLSASNEEGQKHWGSSAFDSVAVNITVETKFVGEEHLYHSLKPSPTETQLALKIGEPIMLLRRPSEVEWKNYRYATAGECWWITYVDDFDGRLYAVRSENGVALVDLGRSIGDEDVALIETAGCYDDRDLDGKVMTCHLFDVETDDGFISLTLSSLLRVETSLTLSSGEFVNISCCN